MKKILKYSFLIISSFLLLFLIASCGGSKGGNNSNSSNSSNGNNSSNGTKYTVTWKNWNGEVLETDTNLEYGTMPEYNGTTPVKPSDQNNQYIFEKWDKDVTEVTDNVVYMAVYKAIAFTYCTVTFDSNGGSSVNPQSILKGEKAYKPINPTREGYSFDDWYYHGEKWSFIGYVVTENMTLEARWNANQYSLNLYSNNFNAGKVLGNTGPHIYNETITIRATTNPGYTFIGWYDGDKEITKEESYTFKMPTKNLSYTAKWSVNEDTQYKVEHYLQNINDDKYTIDTTETLYGETNTFTQASAKEYTGFNTPSVSQQIISGDGSTIIKLYYTRNNYTLTLDKNIDKAGTVVESGTYKYDKVVTITATTNPGYTFIGWYDGENEITKEASYTFKMPTNNLSYTAKWAVNTDTQYKVEHYLQNIDDDNYPEIPYETDNLTGTTNTLTNGEVNTYVGFATPKITQVNINGDGSTVISLYYTRNSYSITLSKNIAAGSITGSGTYKYDKVVTITATTNPGYTFIGWYDGENEITKEASYTFKMPTNNLSYTAKWTVNTDTQYIVEHYLENANDNYYKIDTTETLYGETDTYTQASAKEYTGFNAPNVRQQIISGDGSTVIKLYYNRERYEVTIIKKFINNSNIKSSKKIVNSKYGSNLKIQMTPYLGYDFDGFYMDDVYLTSESSYEISNISQNIEIDMKWNVLPELENFEFTTIGNELTINSVIDNTISSMILTDIVTGIKENAFSGCNLVANIEIGKNITYIGTDAFKNNNALLNVYYDGTVEDWFNIKFNSFYSNPMYYATNFYILDENGDIEYNGNKYSLLEEVIIPDSITTIDYQLYCFKKIKKVIISNSVINIGYDAFYNCDSMESIEIPKSITNIGTLAFYCESLKNVYYDGTIEDWCNISFGGSSSNPMYYGSYFYILDENGDIEFNGNKYSLLTELVIPDTITAINDYQFYRFNNIENIEISNSVTSIGKYALGGTHAKKIEIPTSVESIGLGAFSGCSSLESISIPFIGYKRYTSEDTYQYPLGYIFGANSYIGGTETRQYYYSSSTTDTTITTYYIPTSLKEVIITDSNYILYGAFSGFSKLQNIIISKEVTSIEDYAFFGCSSLKSIDIPSTVTNIGKCAFYGCSSLKSIDIPQGVTNIGYQAFYDTSIRNLELPTSIKSIGGRIFNTSIEKLYYDGTIKDWCDIKFSDIPYMTGCYGRGQLYILDENGDVEYNGNKYSLLTDIVIPDTVTAINNYQFSYLRQIKSITIPDSVTYIGKYAFEKCSSITNIILPKYIKQIEEETFYECSSLTSIFIPESVTYIGLHAFEKCSSLKTIYYGGTYWMDVNVAYLSVDGYPFTYVDIYVYSEEEPSSSSKYKWHYVDGEIVIWE